MTTTIRADESRPRFMRARDKLALWSAMLGSPLAALLMVAVGFSAAHGGCVIDSHGPIHIVGVATLALAVLSCFLSFRYWRMAGRDWRSEIPGPLGRARLMAGVGLLSAALFIPLILAAWSAAAFLLPCQGT